jgi:DNA-binding beta-propeller fold protein YncE
LTGSLEGTTNALPERGVGIKLIRVAGGIFVVLSFLPTTLPAARAVAPDVGALIPQGCVDDNDSGADVCAQSTDGLFASRGVAVSPDGTSVYAASGDDAVVHLSRNPTTGAITPQGCIDDNDTGTDVCAQSADGLAGARSVVVSPDGTSVYVASSGDEAVVRFDRNTTTGALTPQGCIDDNDTGGDVCAQSTDGLAGSRGVTVSPDGTSVFVASGGGFDNAVVRFDRSTVGALTPLGCIDDNDPGQGPDACAQSTDGLFGVTSVAVSPDGASVYAAGDFDNAMSGSTGPPGEPSPPRDAWRTTTSDPTTVPRAPTGWRAPAGWR